MNKNTIKTIAYCSITMLIGTYTSSAQSDDKPQGNKPPTLEEIFKQMDTDKDGKLSKKEVKGPLKDDFTKIDLDKDGFITKEELKKAPKPEGKRPEKKE